MQTFPNSISCMSYTPYIALYPNATKDAAIYNLTKVDTSISANAKRIKGYLDT